MSSASYTRTTALTEIPATRPGAQEPWYPVVQIGAWDADSIMNSGNNAFGNGLGYLSRGDRAGARVLYGRRATRSSTDFNGSGPLSGGSGGPHR